MAALPWSSAAQTPKGGASAFPVLQTRFVRPASPGYQEVSPHNASTILSFSWFMTGEGGGRLPYYISPNISVGKEIGKIFTQLQALKPEGGGAILCGGGKGLKGHGLLRGAVLQMSEGLQWRLGHHGLADRECSEASTYGCGASRVKPWTSLLGLGRPL